MKLSPQEILDFEQKFYTGLFPNQRYGQAFCNNFNIENFPVLFYQEDERLARVNAWFIYLEEEKENK